MDLVVDANVLFSALIKEGFTYNLLFNEKFHLFTPEYIFTELEKHKEEILEKTERSEEEFFRFFLTNTVNFIKKANSLWKVSLVYFHSLWLFKT